MAQFPRSKNIVTIRVFAVDVVTSYVPTGNVLTVLSMLSVILSALSVLKVL